MQVMTQHAFVCYQAHRQVAACSATARLLGRLDSVLQHARRQVNWQPLVANKHTYAASPITLPDCVHCRGARDHGCCAQPVCGAGGYFRRWGCSCAFAVVHLQVLAPDLC